jgi:hypothetical protein
VISGEVKSFFRYFDEVYDNKEQYKMEWAFKDAQEKMDGFQEEVIQNKIQKKCRLKDGFSSLYQSFYDDTRRAIRRQKWLSRIFSNTYTLLTLLEFLISVLFVLFVSEISHSGVEVIKSPVFSAWVVIIFAFIKVFIEHFYIRPKMEIIGWQLYRRSVEMLKNLTVSFSEQLNLE